MKKYCKCIKINKDNIKNNGKYTICNYCGGIRLI